MNKYVKKYIHKIANDRKIGIFGAGKKSYVAEELLRTIGIYEYVFFDNNQIAYLGEHNKSILNVNQITKDYFILISTVYFTEIKKQLDDLGMKEVEDYIWALDLEFYDALIHFKDAPRVPNISMADLAELELEIAKYVEVKVIDWFDEKDFLQYENNLGFQIVYDRMNNARYRRKIMEYYFVDKLAGFEQWDKDDIYIDVGAAGSPFVKYLREKKRIKAFGLDLNKGKFSELPYYLQEDATNMHFLNNEISLISLQSSYETFMKNADIDFIWEAARVLKKGGKVIICPLYLHKQYLSTVSPNYYCTGNADKDSLECIRVDCRGSLPLGRFYDVNAFYMRVLKNVKQCGLVPTVYSLPQELVEKDEFVYLKFILELKKIDDRF